MKMLLNNIKNITVLICAVLTLNSSFSQNTVIDKVIAQVGDEIIMLSDIQKAKLQLIQEGMEVNKNDDIRILEELLYQKLLLNQSKIDSIEVSDEQVNANMEQRIRYFEAQIGGREELEKFYGKSIAQIKGEFFKTIKENMLSEAMQDKITENINITPNDISEFFNKLPTDSIPYINSKISVAQIVIYPEITEADKIKAFNEITKIREEVVKGRISFQAAATRYSEDPGSKYKDGDLGWTTRGTMVPEFESAAFALEKNSISPVFETQYGYHFLQLLDRKGDNYRVRHVLISTKADDKALDAAAVKIEKIYKEINSTSITFEKAAEKYSNDEASKFNGGKIVNPYTNDYYWDINNINEIDPQLYRIIQGLSTNQMTRPSLYENYREQKIGLRMVKLLGKTSPHAANLKDDYQLIQKACIEAKKQEVIDDWINSKIAGAYIRIDDSFKNAEFKYNWNQ
ncbi:MAG: peptidylprolyl isomerase [Putridiphycobacter sp.]|nr:peptidylprolyl isomerase [Putridiphycobacter sp.]